MTVEQLINRMKIINFIPGDLRKYVLKGVFKGGVMSINGDIKSNIEKINKSNKKLYTLYVFLVSF